MTQLPSSPNTLFLSFVQPAFFLTLIFQCVQYATVELIAFEHFSCLIRINIWMFFEELDNLKLVNVPLTYFFLMID